MPVARLDTLRFSYDSANVDYTRYFPDIDILQAHESPSIGINPVNWHLNWIKNETITFQLINPTIVKVFKPNGTQETLTPTEITPAGWATSERYYLVSYKPTSDGVYYFSYLDDQFKAYISDKIYVNSRYKNRLVEIIFTDTQNKFDTIFVNENGTTVFAGRVFFEGLFLPTKPENTITTYKTSNEKPKKTNSYPQVMKELTLVDLPFHYPDLINHIFSCDTVKVNGILVDSNEEVFDYETFPRSILGDGKIKLQVVTDDYLVNKY